MNKTLIDYIKTELLPGEEDLELTAEDDLLNSGLIDSLGIMRLIGHIEKTYDFKVPPQDMVIENFMSVDAISAYIQRVRS